jgi:hypothetical protein
MRRDESVRLSGGRLGWLLFDVGARRPARPALLRSGFSSSVLNPLTFLGIRRLS